MSSASPNRFTGPNNELVKERNRAAAERTMTAWIQNCLTLIGFGVAIEEIGFALDQRFPDQDFTLTSDLTLSISLVFIALGIALLLIAMLQHRIAVQSIAKDDYLQRPSYSFNTVVLGATLTFGLLAILAIALN